MKLIFASLLSLSLCITSACSTGPSEQLRRYRSSGTRIRNSQRFIGKSPVRGNRSAPVTVMVFSDFQCNHCKDLAETLDSVYKSHPKNVRIVYKNLPLGFHRQAKNAAIVALAAGRQGKFWQMHDLLFENQTQLNNKFYFQAAARLELDMQRFKRDVKSDALKKQVRLDESLAAQWAIRSTPKMIINGEMLSGAQPRDVLEHVISKYL